MPWAARRQALDDLDLAARSGGAAHPTIWVANGTAMQKATRAVQAEGTVPNRRARLPVWLLPAVAQAKHKVEEKLHLAGWRPSTPVLLR
jgi:hypothetical protein